MWGQGLSPLWKACGLVDDEKDREVLLLQAEKGQLLEAPSSAEDLVQMREEVREGRERRAEACRILETTFKPALDVWEERQKQGGGVDAMAGVVEKQSKAVEDMTAARFDSFAFKSKYLHAAGIVVSQLSDKINNGLPFVEDVLALNNMNPQPTHDAAHVAVLNSFDSVMHTGVHTLGSLQTSFASLASTINPATPDLPAKLATVATKLHNGEVGAAIKDVEGLSDEVCSQKRGRGGMYVFLRTQLSIAGGTAERDMMSWHKFATEYSVAQQGLHFFACELAAQRYSVCHPSAPPPPLHLWIGQPILDRIPNTVSHNFTPIRSAVHTLTHPSHSQMFERYQALTLQRRAQVSQHAQGA